MNTQDLVDNWRAHARRCDEAAQHNRAVLRGEGHPMLGHTLTDYAIFAAKNEKAAEILRKCADELEQA